MIVFFSKTHTKLLDFDFLSLEVEIKRNVIKVEKILRDGKRYLEYYINGTKINDKYSKNNINERDLYYLLRDKRDKYRQISENEVVDLSSNTVYDIHELIEYNYDNLPQAFKKNIQYTIPKKISDIISDFPVVFISANRLKTLRHDDTRDWRPSYDVSSYSDTVKLYSAELKLSLQKELSKYANVSQKLDKNFPKQVIELLKDKSSITETLNLELRDKVNLVRQQHITAGILESESDADSLEIVEDVDTLDKQAIKIMNLYYQDTMEKLDTLSPISAKIILFIDSLNNKFKYSNKKIKISSEFGIVCYNFHDGNETMLDISLLSSGEQQEIILLYDFIFRASNGGLVLIDEPEISLHIKWQRQFLDDIESIMKINKFQVLVATHSPQIIGDRNQQIINLGRVD